MNWAASTLDEGKVRAFIRDHRIGSFLNSPLAGNSPGVWTAKQWRQAMRTIQRIAKEEGVVPLIHGLDSVHGANYVAGSTIFPQQVNLGATFNPAHAREMGRVTARDTMAAGIQWIYGPILDLGINSRWPRMYETFSEDPHLVGIMGAEVIRGIQNFTQDGLSAAACAKHFIAYSATSTGQDQSPVLLDARDVANYYLTPYKHAVAAGVRTFMESYQEISGVPMVSSRQYLKDLLRYELAYEGFLVTDYGEVNGLHGEHAVARTNREAVKIAMLDTSIDMSMTAWDVDFATDLIDLVNKGEVPMERVDESVARCVVVPASLRPILPPSVLIEWMQHRLTPTYPRMPPPHTHTHINDSILQTKEDLGLLDHAFDLVQDDSPLDALLGSAEDKALAMEAIRESITLLKNEGNRLPLDANRPLNILVVGPTANSLSYQSGGWTMHWTGPLGDHEFNYGTTLVDGIKKLAAAGSTVDYLPGVDTEGKWVTDRDQLADRARQADVIVLGVGEKAYAEASANIPDVVLPRGQHDLATLLAAESDAPLVTVLFQGRPRLLGTCRVVSCRTYAGAAAAAAWLAVCPSRPRERRRPQPPFH